MRCFGRNKDYTRCKNVTRFLVCSKHKFQLIILILVTIPTLSLTYILLIPQIKNLIIKEKPILIRETSVIKSRYPGPILVHYYYPASDEKITSVGYASYLECINNSDVNIRITYFFLELKINNEWAQIPRIHGSSPLNAFWAVNNDLKNCDRLDFSKNWIDVLLKNKELKPYESVKGWAFFEWPKEYRKKIPEIQGVRYTFINNHGKEVRQKINRHKSNFIESSYLDGGSIDKIERGVDISHCELLQQENRYDNFKNQK